MVLAADRSVDRTAGDDNEGRRRAAPPGRRSRNPGPEAAERGLEHALALSRVMGARPYTAHAQIGLAQALRMRGADADRARADQLESEALATARELGMARLLHEAAPARARR